MASATDSGGVGGAVASGPVGGARGLRVGRVRRRIRRAERCVDGVVEGRHRERLPDGVDFGLHGHVVGEGEAVVCHPADDDRRDARRHGLGALAQRQPGEQRLQPLERDAALDGQRAHLAAMQVFGQILGDQAAVLERCPVNDGLPVGDADGQGRSGAEPLLERRDERLFRLHHHGMRRAVAAPPGEGHPQPDEHRSHPVPPGATGHLVSCGGRRWLRRWSRWGSGRIGDAHGNGLGGTDGRAADMSRSSSGAVPFQPDGDVAWSVPLPRAGRLRGSAADRA